MMKRVLVTGAGGFIGRHTLPMLARLGFEIHAVTSRTPPPALPADHWHALDLLDAGGVERLVREVRPTHLLHLAWDVRPRLFWESLDNLRWVQAGLGLLRVFQTSGGRRVVAAGTCAEYDWRYERCSEESTPKAPGTLYGTSKHALQLLQAAACARTGVSGAWGRIFFPYGPHEHPDRLIPSVVRALLAGHEALVSHGKQVRDLLYVQDVADAFACLLDSDLQGPVNIGSGASVTLREVVERIAERLGRRDLVRFGAVEPALHDPPVLLAETRRLREELGYTPACSLDEGLDRTIAWWRSQMAGA